MHVCKDSPQPKKLRIDKFQDACISMTLVNIGQYKM